MNTIYEISICFIACCLFRVYASLSGIKDGLLYGRPYTMGFRWKEHKIYLGSYIIIMVMFLGGYFSHELLDKREIALLIILFNSLLGFSFWHNGHYYITMGDLINTDYRFSYNGFRHKSIVEFSWKTRLWMEIFSWALFIFYFLYIWFY